MRARCAVHGTMARTLETAQAIVQATSVAAQTDDRLREFGNCYADGLAVPAECMPVVYADFGGRAAPRPDQRPAKLDAVPVRVGRYRRCGTARAGATGTTVVVVSRGVIVPSSIRFARTHRRSKLDAQYLCIKTEYPIPRANPGGCTRTGWPNI